MLEIERNFIISSQIEYERKRINLKSSSNDDGNESTSDETEVPIMSWECKHAHTNVSEDKVLGYEVAQLKQRFSSMARFIA
jgi:hypothetical protein